MATLRQAAVACAVRAAAGWPDDRLEAGRRIEWPTGDYAQLAAATTAALAAEHDRRIFDTDTATAWAQVVNVVTDLPGPALHRLVEWALQPEFSTSSPVTLWSALACVVAAGRIVERAEIDDPLRQR